MHNPGIPGGAPGSPDEDGDRFVEIWNLVFMQHVQEADEIVGMVTVDPEHMAERQVLVVSEKGYGKRSPVVDYRITKRGGKGVKTLQVTDKTGQLIAIKEVKEDDQLMIINRSGITIRMGLDEMRVLGRATQGVRLIELRKNDQIAAVAKVDSDLKEDEVPEEGEPAEGGSESGSDDAATNGTEVAEEGNDE